MATYTLAQYAQLEKEPLAKGVMLGIAQEGVVADLLHWRTINALSETGVRYDEVISPLWIPLDGSISTGTANGHQISHSVYELAFHVDIPKPLQDLTGNQL